MFKKIVLLLIVAYHSPSFSQSSGYFPERVEVILSEVNGHQGSLKLHFNKGGIGLYEDIDGVYYMDNGVFGAEGVQTRGHHLLIDLKDGAVWSGNHLTKEPLNLRGTLQMSPNGSLSLSNPTNISVRSNTSIGYFLCVGDSSDDTCE